MNTTNKVYTAADFERYNAGSMSGKEMHALERAALEDPFLADALEGYAYTTTPAADISALQERLAEKTSDKKIFFLSPKAKNGWLRIAAMLVLFAGLATVFYKVNYKKSQNDLAVNKPENIVKPTITKDSQVVTKIDTSVINQGQNQVRLTTTTTAATSPAPSKFKTEQSASTIVSASQATGNNNNDYNFNGRYDTVNRSSAPVLAELSDATKEKYKIIKPPVSITPAAIDAVKKDQDDRFASAKYEEVKRAAKSLKKEETLNDFKLKGKVTDDDGSPIAGAAVTVNGSTAAITDRSGNFSIQTNESKVTASVASEGYAARDLVLNNNAANNVSLGKQNIGMVSASNHIGNNDDNARLLKQALDNKPVGTLRDKAKMDPVDSVVFINYLEKNLKEERRITGEPYSGKVILSFTVSRKGRPENIRTEQSLCEACDKQATTLLINGPKWIYSFGKRKLIVIEFPPVIPQ